MDVKLPIGWTIRPLSQVATVRSGVAMSKTRLKDPVTLPYLRVANVQAGFLDLSDVRTIQVERHQVERFTLQVGDVLMTEGGDFDKLGRGDLWRGEIAQCLHQNHVFVVRTDPSLVLPEFLNALSNSRYGRNYFLSCAKRSTNLASINASQLRRFPVLLPPLEEQRSICEKLAKLDHAVACAERIVANRRQQQLGIRQELFAALGMRQCPRKAVSSLATLPTDTLNLAGQADAAFRYITLSDVTAGEINPALQEIALEKAPSRARRKVCPGDVLVSTVRPNLQGYARIDQHHADCIVSTGFAVLRARPGVDGGYLYHYLFSPDVQHQIRSMVTGSSYPSINLTDVRNLTMPLPPLVRQKEIAHALDMAATEIRIVERQRELWSQEKYVWTQRLVTGQWRLNQWRHVAGPG